MLILERINLKKFRIDKGLKSKEMAEKTGISKEHYSNIETGKKIPTSEYIDNFERIFNVDAKDVWVLFKKPDGRI